MAIVSTHCCISPWAKLSEPSEVASTLPTEEVAREFLMFKAGYDPFLHIYAIGSMSLLHWVWIVAFFNSSATLWKCIPLSYVLSLAARDSLALARDTVHIASILL